MADIAVYPVRVYERDQQGVLLNASIKVGKWHYTKPLFDSPQAASRFLRKHGKKDVDYVLVDAVATGSA